MTIQLRLDAAALDRLFPVGTESRADLARNVVYAMVSKLALKDVKFLHERAEGDVRRLVLDTVRNEKLFEGYSSESLTLSSSFVEEIRKKIKVAVAEEMERGLYAEVRKATEAIKVDLAPMVKDRLDQWLTPTFEEKLRQRIQSVLRDTLMGGK